MIVYSDFTAAFPEFANAATYPEAQVDFWIAQAYAQLSASIFGTSLDFAAMLFAAHNIVLGARDARASTGGIAGGSSGLVTSKSVDKVSVSYDVNATAYQGAGFWNATSYGQRLYQMMRARSAGPWYVPGPARPVLPMWRGPRW